MDAEPQKFSQLKRSQIAPFVSQLLLVPPIATVLTLILLVPIDWLPMFRTGGAECPLQSIDVLILTIVAFVCGLIAAKWKPSLLLPSGLWIWSAPITLLLLLVLPDITSPQFVSYWSDLVCADGSNEGLVKYFIGYPSFACIGYSMGLYGARPRKPRQTESAD